jgi:putative addiction module component (TIGR02574 family)
MIESNNAEDVEAFENAKRSASKLSISDKYRLLRYLAQVLKEGRETLPLSKAWTKEINSRLKDFDEGKNLMSASEWRKFWAKMKKGDLS